MKSLRNWIVLIVLAIPLQVLSKPLTYLTPPDTICVDTATVKKWANDKIVLKNQVEYLTNELTESKAFEQRCKLENLSLVSELDTVRRRKARSIIFACLSGVVFGLVIR